MIFIYKEISDKKNYRDDSIIQTAIRQKKVFFYKQKND